MIDRVELESDAQYTVLALSLDQIDQWTGAGAVIYADWTNWLDGVNGLLDNAVIKLKPPLTRFPDIGHAS